MAGRSRFALLRDEAFDAQRLPDLERRGEVVGGAEISAHKRIHLVRLGDHERAICRCRPPIRGSARPAGRPAGDPRPPRPAATHCPRNRLWVVHELPLRTQTV
jgi:hypothetical protein